jgi:hypothetical protein
MAQRAEADRREAELMASDLVSDRPKVPSPVRGITAGDMEAPEDRAQDIVEWLFGVPDAPLPKRNMRSASELYLAMTGDEAWQGSIVSDKVQFAAATTTALPNLVVIALNKLLVEMNQDLTQYRWYEPISHVMAHDGTLNPVELLMVNGVQDLPIVQEGKAYVEAEASDTKETAYFTKRGMYLGITMEMWRANDIERMRFVPRTLMRAAIRTRSRLMAEIFTTNSGMGPTMAGDSKTLFHADHNNYDTTAFSHTAWKAARLECWKQTEGGSNKRLGMYPSIVLLPGDLYDDAVTIFSSAQLPGSPNNDVNIYQNKVTPIAVPDWTDANDWVYMVPPSLVPIVNVAYGNVPGGGTHPTPEIFAVTGEANGLMFTNDTMPVKIRDIFAWGVSTYRGIGKRVVA